MKSESFVYWLQGFFEISEATTLNEKQIQIIKNHLNMVFVHDIDPKLGSEDHLDRLMETHNDHFDPYDRNTVFSC